MKKRNKIIYWVSTVLLSLMMVMSAGMYLFNTSEVAKVFVLLGYNTRIIIPLAILKLLGVTAILTNRSKVLKEWAYFGFFIDFLLALEGHLSVGDGEHGGAIIALVLLVVSYSYNRLIDKSTVES